MPKLFTLLGYVIFFWSHENGEPIHVHIAKGNPHPNATKIWLTRDGECIVENNNDRIPQTDMKKLLVVISAQFFMICSAWKKHFGESTVKFIR